MGGPDGLICNMNNKIPAKLGLASIQKLILPVLIVYLAYRIGGSLPQGDYKLLYIIGMVGLILAINRNQLQAIFIFFFLMYLIPQRFSIFKITTMTDFRVSTVAYIIIIIAYFFYLIKHGGNKPVFRNKKLSGGIKIFILLYLISGIISATIPFAQIFLAKFGLIPTSVSEIGQTESFNGTIETFGCFMLVLLIRTLFDTGKKVTNFLKYFTIIGCVASLFGWMEHFGNMSYWGAYYQDRLELPNGGIEVGTLLVLPICWSLTQSITRKTISSFFIFLFLGLAVILSLTRSNIIGVVFSLLILVVLGRGTAYKAKIILLFLITVFGISVFLSQYQFVLNFQFPRLLSKDNFLTRKLVQEDAIQKFTMRGWNDKVFGTGYETYESASYGIDATTGQSIIVTQSVHNEFLKLLMNQGIVGLISILGILWMTFYNCYRVRKLEAFNKNSPLSQMANVVMASMTGWIIMLNASITPVFFMFFVYLGLSLVLKDLAGENSAHVIPRS